MSHTKSTGNQRLDFYTRFFEYARAVTDVVVTEEGVYLKDEVPDTYGGAQLEVRIVDAVYMVNARYETQILEFENDPPMDKEKKKGGPVKRNGVELRAATGDSTTIVNQTIVINANLDADRKQIAEGAINEIRAAYQVLGQRYS